MRDIDFKYRLENDICSLRELLQRGEIVAKREIVKNKYNFNRAAFNRMDYSQQKEYFKKLNIIQQTYEVILKDETMIDINKKQFDQLEVFQLPRFDRSEKY